MVGNSFGSAARVLITTCLAAFSFSGSLHADDTEIYQGTTDRPKVLIAFDDSGSMGTIVAGDADGRTRMEIVQSVVTSLISENTDIDFGLLEYNSNIRGENYHGGRIVQAIVSDMTVGQRTDLIDLFDDISHGGSTPLCESTYEAYLYLFGKTLKYGDRRQRDNDQRDKLDRDTTIDAEDPEFAYVSPVTDCGSVFLIVLTDGEPQNDTDANSDIKDLVGKTSSCGIYPAYGQPDTENCMPELAEYMATTDMDENIDGDQFVTTYTIGFTTEQDLLEHTAEKGGGEYYTADNADQLAAKFEEVFAGIRSINTTFSSPAAAVDSFTRTQSLDDVIFSMFKPQSKIDWPGNIKKVKIDISSGVATFVNGEVPPKSVLDSSGEFIEGRSTFWSSGDGGEVTKGGAGELLLARNPAGLNSRILLTNSSTNGALEVFDSTNLDAEAYGFDDDGELFDFFEVDDQAQLDAAINWGKGYEVADDGTLIWPDPSDPNYSANYSDRWILKDMLHSQPLVINYGALSPFTDTNPDLRIVVGTNAGFFHMFGNNDGEENWAFFPKELASVLTRRLENTVSTDHVYGIDASPVLYTRDLDHDGTIEWNSNSDLSDRAWVFFGLRRGGHGLYAMDISDPDAPKFKWHIDQNTTNFGELGETWSDPVVTRIPGHVDDNGVPKPVLVFGAGYDPINDDSGLAAATVDTMGRGLFIVDASSGDLVWSVTPASDSATNLEEDDLEHSVAAKVTPLDSNGDELTDRIYFADTGGNLWRVDLPGNCLPSDSNCQSDDPPPPPWSIVKLAEMNGGDVATDRRFFNAPDVVRTSYAGSIFDAVSIGSGDRTNPKATDVNNQFYMIKDQQVNPYFTAAPSCPADPYDFRCDLPLNPFDPAPDPNDPNVSDPFLYDVTDNFIQEGNPGEKDAAQKLLRKSNGWYMNLTFAGEKSLSSSITIAGTTYFGTYSPETGLADACHSEGTARLYVVNLLNAAAAFDFDPATSFERSWPIGSLIPDTPTVHIDEDGVIRLLLPPGSAGGGNMSNPFLTGASLPDPYGEYWYREEY